MINLDESRIKSKRRCLKNKKRRIEQEHIEIVCLRFTECNIIRFVIGFIIRTLNKELSIFQTTSLIHSNHCTAFVKPFSYHSMNWNHFNTKLLIVHSTANTITYQVIINEITPLLNGSCRCYCQN